MRMATTPAPTTPPMREAFGFKEQCEEHGNFVGILDVLDVVWVLESWIKVEAEDTLPVIVGIGVSP